MNNKISRLDEIGRIINDDIERMGQSPSISEKLDHLAYFGVHKAIIAIRNLGRVVVDEIGEFAQNPESNPVDSDK